MVEIAGVAKEIERKFLLTGIPPGVLGHEPHLCYHGWLPGEVIQERITWLSRGGGEYWRTIKAGSGIERIEAQERISKELYDVLYALTVGKRVSKFRYSIKDNDVLWEIDQFLDRELFMAEAEIPNADFNLVIPDWLQPFVAQEVTENSAYVNVNLAK